MRSVKHFFFRLFVTLLILGILASLVVFSVSSSVKNRTEDSVVYVVTGEVEINPVSQDSLRDFHADCILVLGAGIEDKETPTPMLKDRLDVGIELYREGIAPKILLSGDNGQVEHNEIHVMLNYVRDADVPEEDIFCDHAGFSTYDSMYRAGSIFGANKVIVVTQKYHEYRALYIGKKLGLDVIGLASDQRSYFGVTYRELREMLARFKDVFKATFRSRPTLEGDTIPISGSGVTSHGE